MPLAREFSEETARQIDAQIQQLLGQAEARVRDTLGVHRPALNELAQRLLTQETVERPALTKILRDSKRSRTPAAAAESAAMV
jgi:cell division protease FtsH